VAGVPRWRQAASEEAGRSRAQKMRQQVIPGIPGEAAAQGSSGRVHLVVQRQVCSEKQVETYRQAGRGGRGTWVTHLAFQVKMPSEAVQRKWYSQAAQWW